MRKTTILYLIFLGAFSSQAAFAVHPMPAVNNSCLYVMATPHRPDPQDSELTTPEQRCQAADIFALSNVPTEPVGVITPSGEPRYYCTVDGSTLAVPLGIAASDPALANTLPAATACAGDAVCVQLFGDDASCEEFGPDVSGRRDNGWVSLGPASSFALASDLDGDPGAHSVYVRSPGGRGNIFYFQGGMNRTHSLTAPRLAIPGDLPVLDITFCKAPTSPVVQRGRPEGCEGFFCRPVPCCGPHFPCDGYPNFAPLLQEPEERLAGLDLQLEALLDSGDLGQGQAYAMRQRIVNIFSSLDSGDLSETCHHMDQLVFMIGQSVVNGSLSAEDAEPLEAEATAVQGELGCS